MLGTLYFVLRTPVRCGGSNLQLLTSNFTLIPFNLQPLPFDSSLFNYLVAKTKVGQDWNENSFLDAASAFQLVYIFSDSSQEFRSSDIQFMGEKVTFKKLLSQPNLVDGFQVFNSSLNQQITSLALESGKYSRFKKDPRLNQKEFENLYQHWIEKAIEEDIVLTNKSLTAMVTLSVEEKEASIGLLAVDEKERGKGLGRQLVLASENEAIHSGAETLLIPTQSHNIPACRLYQSLGYEVAERVFIYHYFNPASLR